MKKNVIFRIAAVVLMCALVTACFASSTFARYTSLSSAESTVSIASWSINAGDDDITESASFDLTASTVIYEEDNYGKKDEEAKAVAPGTCGSFSFNLTNNSDVAANWTATISTEDAPANLKFYKTNTSGVLSDEITELEGTLGIASTDKTATVTIYWQWELGDEAEDNDYAGEDFKVTVDLKADQKD